LRKKCDESHKPTGRFVVGEIEIVEVDGEVVPMVFSFDVVKICMFQEFRAIANRDHYEHECFKA
jgi:hypothetical protein